MIFFSSFLGWLLPIIFGVIIAASLADLVLRIKKGLEWRESKTRKTLKKVFFGIAGLFMLVLMITVVNVMLPFS